MKKDMIQLPVRFNFHEYFDAITGKGYGSHRFSWTSALFIDLVEEYYDEDRRSLTWFGMPAGRSLKEKRVLNWVEGRLPTPSRDLAPKLMSSIGAMKARFYDMQRGRVDYKAMKESETYRAYLRLASKLCRFDLTWVESREEKLSFWINLYNTIVVHGIIELEIRSSVREISDFFSHLGYEIGGHFFSLDDIEHGILRSNARPPYRVFSTFKRQDPRRAFIMGRLDPRIHFALVCGSRSCAPIDFYSRNAIDEQLDEATRNFVNSSEVVILPEKNKLLLSEIFTWYAKDFGKRKDILDFILRHLSPDDKAAYLAEHQDDIEMEYLFYDWNLNH
jgi:hypothetical protein